MLVEFISRANLQSIYHLSRVRGCVERPVFDEERRRCTAWSRGFFDGGITRAQEAEREEMARIRESKREAEERQYLAFEKVRLHNAPRSFPSKILFTQTCYHRRGIEAYLIYVFAVISDLLKSRSCVNVNVLTESMYLQSPSFSPIDRCLWYR